MLNNTVSVFSQYGKLTFVGFTNMCFNFETTKEHIHETLGSCPFNEIQWESVRKFLGTLEDQPIVVDLDWDGDYLGIQFSQFVIKF